MVIGSLTWINLRGVGEASRLELITVYGKLFVLIGLAVLGLFQWAPNMLEQGISPQPWHTAIVGAATIFMAYEGFQLLAYDYEELQQPDKTLPKATMWAVVAVILVYITVSLGTTMLVGADVLIEKKEIALAEAGQQALGTTGLIIVTIAAAFSTASAINATLFSTGRLMENVASKNDLPKLFVKENEQHIPYYAIIFIGVFSSVLAVTRDLSGLVDAASLIFLFTFGTVNYIAFIQRIRYFTLSLLGAIACGLAMVADIIFQLQNDPIPLLILLGVTILIITLRPLLLKKN